MNLWEMGGRIKMQRKSMQISQEVLAELIGVSPHYIYEIERGMKAMSIETLANISKALSISTDYILFGSEKPTPSIYEQLEKMDSIQKARAESAFEAILPFIR
ncbi:MAG: helix-turn-helix transcriptional regulator [Ruminiclostridium sp.]|nr:helix-turn-helix transcriptional regulator [Ruminococcus sp.]MBP3856683.1 helix-turn-helix transcriptional regulator [Ruminiclostridium sp.]